MANRRTVLKRTPVVKSANGQLDQAEVARVAHELFRQRGGAHGSDVEDWLDAEVIVRQRWANTLTR